MSGKPLGYLSRERYKVLMRPFGSIMDYIAYLWIIGNAILEPIRRSKVLLLLLGAGGNGKTMLLEYTAPSMGKIASSAMLDRGLCKSPFPSRPIDPSMLEGMATIVSEGDTAAATPRWPQFSRLLWRSAHRNAQPRREMAFRAAGAAEASAAYMLNTRGEE